MAYAGKANASKTWFVEYAAKLGPSTKLTDDLFLFELSGGVLYNGVISVCFMRYTCITSSPAFRPLQRDNTQKVDRLVL